MSAAGGSAVPARVAAVPRPRSAPASRPVVAEEFHRMLRPSDAPLPQAIISRAVLVAAPAQALGMGRVNRDPLAIAQTMRACQTSHGVRRRTAGHAFWSIGSDPVNDRDQACPHAGIIGTKKGIRFLHVTPFHRGLNGHFAPSRLKHFFLSVPPSQ